MSLLKTLTLAELTALLDQYNLLMARYELPKPDVAAANDQTYQGEYVTTEHDIIALLKARRKPVITQQQLDQIISKTPKVPNPPMPQTPRRIKFWGYYKETTAFLADTIAVLPILGITGNLINIEGWIAHLWMVS